MTQAQAEITLDPRRIQVLFGGHGIADSDQVLLVREAGEQPVLYFPRKDVEMTILARTGLDAFSGSKGVATHFTVYRDANVVENAAWSFEEPPSPFELIAAHIAFNPVHFEFAAHGESPADFRIEPTAAAPAQTAKAVSVIFASADDLASALHRAAAAHHLHEARTGATDPDWPSWYAAYIVSEGTERGAPVQT